MSKKPRVVFMGTPHFAAGCLQTLLDHKINVVAAVTATDKPTGRGHQVQFSAVKQLALNQNIPVLQPEKLKSPEFLEKLQSLNADLFIVVAFRMLPEAVWAMPSMGTVNLHASLLPQYRGAAPINWAIINGEVETGVTTFLIEKEIDTGKILLQEKMPIGENETAGLLHDRMMEIGGKMLVKTIHGLSEGKLTPTPQEKLIDGELKEAPKLFKENSRINWGKSAKEIHNHIRGLSPFPGTWTNLIQSDNEVVQVKIHAGQPLKDQALTPGNIETDGKTYLHVGTAIGAYQISEWQFPGKRKMSVEESLRGIKWQETWYFE